MAVIALSRDPTIPRKWGVQLCWWRYSFELDEMGWYWQPRFMGYFR